MTDVIATKRLLMRRWTERDVAPFAAMNADPSVTQFFSSMTSHEQSAALVKRIESQFDERGFELLVVEVDGEFAGFTGLNVMTFETPMGFHVEIGWRFAR